MASIAKWQLIDPERRREQVSPEGDEPSVLAKVRSRGHWRIRIRPERFEELRLESLAEVERVIEHCKVSIRGWDFPHIGRVQGEGYQRKSGFIEQVTDWEYFLEVWRFYQSGQFIFLGGFPDDWNDQATRSMWSPPSRQTGPIIRVGDALFRATEACELAARLAQTVPGEDGMIIELELVGLTDRHLVIHDPGRAEFGYPRTAKIESWGKSIQIQRPELIAAPGDVAISFCVGLFDFFGWDTNQAFVRDYQRGMMGK